MSSLLSEKIMKCGGMSSVSGAGRRMPRGFTLIELMAASSILIVVVTLALYGFMYAIKENARAMVQNELDMDVQGSMESLKKDLRLSALDKMFFYPLGSGSYSAASFPMAFADSNGTVGLGTNGKISWDETVIFHVWKTSPNQLRRTRFRPRNNSLTDAQIQEQLTYVATNGCATNKAGGGTYGWSNAETTVIFENLFDWSVEPKAGVYDGYDAVTNRDEAVNLGSCIFSNGPHTFTFTVVGSNAASKGLNIGLDTLVMSPNGLDREAELQIPENSVNPTNMLMNNVGSWSHNRQLYFAATTNGSSFTVTMTNDCWEESTFRGTGQILDDTKVVWDTNTMDYVVRLDGNLGVPDREGWYAKRQTETPWLVAGDMVGTSDTNSTLTDCAVRVLLRGSEMESGNFIPYNSAIETFYVYAGAGPLRVMGAYISRCASVSTITPDAVGPFTSLTAPLLVNANGLMPMGITYPIVKTNSYLVTYLVSPNPGEGYAKYWTESNAPGIGCWILPNGAGHEQDANWSANTNVIATSRLYALGFMQECWPTNGYFTSAVCDTKKGAVSNCIVSWEISTNSSCFATLKPAVSIQVRAGNSNDCSDAAAWSNVAYLASSGVTTNLGVKRYVQFRAKLTPCNTAGTGSDWCRLHHVRIAWDGDTRYVDVGGIFTKGPNNGIWEIKVDGQRLVRGIAVNIEIFQDVFSKQGPRRVKSILTSEVTPRNTGK